EVTRRRRGRLGRRAPSESNLTKAVADLREPVVPNANEIGHGDAGGGADPAQDFRSRRRNIGIRGLQPIAAPFDGSPRLWPEFAQRAGSTNAHRPGIIPECDGQWSHDFLRIGTDAPERPRSD